VCDVRQQCYIKLRFTWAHLSEPDKVADVAQQIVFLGSFVLHTIVFHCFTLKFRVSTTNIQNQAPFVNSLPPLFASYASFLFQITGIHIVTYEAFV
jgi:hypothetical protein